MHTDLHLVISPCTFFNHEHSLMLFHHQCLVQFSSSKQQNVNYLSLLLTSRKLGFILPVGLKTKRWRRERRQTYVGAILLHGQNPLQGQRIQRDRQPARHLCLPFLLPPAPSLPPFVNCQSLQPCYLTLLTMICNKLSTP